MLASLSSISPITDVTTKRGAPVSFGPAQDVPAGSASIAQATLQNETARVVSYVTAQASSITSAEQIVADPTLLHFTQTALGVDLGSLPSASSQAAMIKTEISIADFQIPSKLQMLIAAFSERSDMIPLPSHMHAPLPAQAGPAMSSDLQASLQNLKMGG